MRAIIIGDVHGQLHALRGLLAQANLGPRDQVVFVGDLIDRGPDGPGVVRLVADMLRAGAASLVMGNHEYKAIRAYRQGAVPVGGDVHALGEEGQRVFEQAKLHHRIGSDYLVVHGGVPVGCEELPPAAFAEWRALPGKPRRHAERFMYERLGDGNRWQEHYDGRFGVVVHGHSVVPRITHGLYHTSIDTGAGTGGQFLSALVLTPTGARVLRQEILPEHRVQQYTEAE